MDPISAMATASAAFSALKKGFAIGRDIESMASDLSRWMGALSDLDQMEKEAKNPPIFKKLFAGQSIEQEAIRRANKKKAEEKDELKLDKSHFGQIQVGRACSHGRPNKEKAQRNVVSST